MCTFSVFNLNICVVGLEILRIKENVLIRKCELVKFNDTAGATENRLNGIEMRINLTNEMSGLTAKQIKFSKVDGLYSTKYGKILFNILILTSSKSVLHEHIFA